MFNRTTAVAACLVAFMAAPAHADPPRQNVIVGDNGDNSLVGTNRPDAIWGRGGDDLLVGREKADALRAGPGDDVIRAALPKHAPGSGVDLVVGGKGHDTCYVDRDDHVRLCEVVIRRDWGA